MYCNGDAGEGLSHNYVILMGKLYDNIIIIGYWNLEEMRERLKY